MKTSEILNKSADKIREHGWGIGPGAWGHRDGAGLCLEGGIIAAMGLDARDVSGTTSFMGCPAYQSVAAYLEDDSRWPRPEHEFLFEWNDAYGRTAEEVIEVLRACAVIEETRENAEVKVLEPAR